MKSLKQKQKYDKIKKQLCEKNDIKLICITELPYLNKDTMINHIYDCAKAEGVLLPAFDTSIIDLGRIYSINPFKKKKAKKRSFKEIKTELEIIGYVVISTEIPEDKKYEVKCLYCGSSRRTSLTNLRNHLFCSKCAPQFFGQDKRKYGIDDAKEHAIINGGECLNETTPENGVYTYRCSCRWEWSRKSDSISRKQWCPKCKTTNPLKYTINDLQELAAQYEGECKSEIFIGVSKKHKWKCKKGNEFFQSPDAVGRKCWCPCCKKDTRKLGKIKTLKEIRSDRDF